MEGGIIENVIKGSGLMQSRVKARYNNAECNKGKVSSVKYNKEEWSNAEQSKCEVESNMKCNNNKFKWSNAEYSKPKAGDRECVKAKWSSVEQSKYKVQ